MARRRIIFVYIEDNHCLGEVALIFDNGDRDYTIARQRIRITEMTVWALPRSSAKRRTRTENM